MYLVLVQILQTVEKITYDSRNLSLSLSFSLYAGDLWQARITKLDNFISQPRLILSTINRAYSVRLCYLMRAKFSRFPRGEKKKKNERNLAGIFRLDRAHIFSILWEKREKERQRMLLACFIVKGERSRMMSFDNLDLNSLAILKRLDKVNEIVYVNWISR